MGPDATDFWDDLEDEELEQELVSMELEDKFDVLIEMSDEEENV